MKGITITNKNIEKIMKRTVKALKKIDERDMCVLCLVCRQYIGNKVFKAHAEKHTINDIVHCHEKI